MTVKVITTDQISASAGVKCLVFGGSGIGKTVLCGTAPNPIILSGEKGLLSLRKKKTPAIEFTNVIELNEAFSWVTSSKEANQYWTVCLDSVTEVAEVVLAHLIKTVGKTDPRKAYGELIPVMSTIIRQFRDIPNKHVCVIAKAEAFKDELSGMTLFGPSMPGKQLGPGLPYFFDEVFALRMGGTNQQTYRYIQTQPDLQYTAKDRSGELAIMEPPDLNQIFTKILAG
jgi:hypothetical protein